MAFYFQQGHLPKKKHTTFYQKDGKSLYREELVSSRGFDGVFATKYHIHEPTRMIRVEPVRNGSKADIADWPLSYYHFNTDKTVGGNFITARTPYLTNTTCTLSILQPTQPTDAFYRNTYAHECLFVHYGSGTLATEYGVLPFGPGDHLVLPKGTTYQLHCDDYAATKVLVIESADPFDIPSRYQNEYGQLLEHAPYSERDFGLPTLVDPIDKMGEFSLYLKAGERLFIQTVDHHPFDVVGWDGYWYPFSFNIKDFSPIVGKVHQPPPVHQLFHCGTFVVCNFCPRLFDFHPEAIPAPYFHTNVDSCEVLYYVEGDFMSRKGVKEGSITLHPTGLPHGPQPGKTEESVGLKETHEYAVMVDTFAPLNVTVAAMNARVDDYERSWL
jgi:homogentisate 1,2-dioxygenase